MTIAVTDQKTMHTQASKRLQTYIPVLCGIMTSMILVLLLNREYPIVGHDYRMFIPRLIDTKLFLLLNGPAIQWYTPSFGGGLPAYPNPQYIEYSLVQFLAVVMNPWSAVLASTFIVALIGFFAFGQLLEKTLKFHWTSSTLGAIFFIGNGFYVEHMIVGHLGFQLFPLGAVILYAMMDRRFTVLKAMAIIAIVTGLLIQQGGFYIIVIFALSFLITLPMIERWNRELFDYGIVFRKLIPGLVLAGVLTSSKLYAVMSLMRFFPRILSDYYPVGIVQALVGMFAQLLGAMFLAPFLMLTGQDVTQLSGALSNITGSHLGIWETDLGLSPVLIVILAFSLARQIKLMRQKRWQFGASAQFAPLLILIMGIWITTEMTLAKGLIYPLIKELPIIRSLHSNVRFASAFILPLVLLGVLEYENLLRTNQRLASLFPAVAGLSFAALFVYYILPADIYSINFNLSRSLQTDAAVGRGERFPIQRVYDVDDDTVFLAHATNHLRYEALYSDYDLVKGYSLKDYTPLIQVGDVTQVDGGYFNMTNPASLVFPAENGLQRFERIKVDDKSNLEKFVNRRQPQWKLPAIQVVLNWISLAASFITVGLVFPWTDLRSKEQVIPPSESSVRKV